MKLSGGKVVFSKKESPPELEILADFATSGRLDSNQRPPEPHSRSVEGEFLGKYVPFASPSQNLEL